MALFSDYNPKTLEDVLGQQAQAQTAQVNDQAAKTRKKAVAQEAHSGRLMSGVSDYPLADIDTAQGQALSGVQGDLASKLGGISAEDWLNQTQFGRSYGLADLIGKLNKPSTLEEVLGGIGSVGPSVATLAAMA